MECWWFIVGFVQCLLETLVSDGSSCLKFVCLCWNLTGSVGSLVTMFSRFSTRFYKIFFRNLSWNVTSFRSPYKSLFFMKIKTNFSVQTLHNFNMRKLLHLKIAKILQTLAMFLLKQRQIRKFIFCHVILSSLHVCMHRGTNYAYKYWTKKPVLRGRLKTLKYRNATNFLERLPVLCNV